MCTICFSSGVCTTVSRQYWLISCACNRADRVDSKSSTHEQVIYAALSRSHTARIVCNGVRKKFTAVVYIKCCGVRAQHQPWRPGRIGQEMAHTSTGALHTQPGQEGNRGRREGGREGGKKGVREGRSGRVWKGGRKEQREGGREGVADDRPPASPKLTLQHCFYGIEEAQPHGEPEYIEGNRDGEGDGYIVSP